MVFDNSSIKTYMQILYHGTYWLRLWAQLQKHEDRAKQIVDALEKAVMQVSVTHGWRFCNMIASS
jgi:hypothetical protein